VTEETTPVEKEAPTKTLDEYLAEKAAHAVKLALPSVRSANEGSDASKWKNVKPLEKPVEEVYYAKARAFVVVQS
jgi:plasminogen activator inhibitor 1 RNA-binding protein